MFRQIFAFVGWMVMGFCFKGRDEKFISKANSERVLLGYFLKVLLICRTNSLTMNRELRFIGVIYRGCLQMLIHPGSF